MHSSEIRARFLEYFRQHGHAVVASSSLIPQNDPTLFFTNAGMVQFKDTFLGSERRDYKRATTSQKCVRVSGKHNDLENVGHTARHHTFFEMLGNFSFGDYFKAEAIRFAWDFLTQEMKIDAGRLWVTVYEKDDEAWALWRDMIGVPEARIQRLGEADNFWSMGDTGPCGPCTEIHYDHGPAISDDTQGPAGGNPRYVEIWNLVFMQYDRSADGTLTPLPRPSIDTGMGLDRLTAVVQGVYTNYDTDLFQVVVQKAAALAGIQYGENEEKDIALKVIADHSRAAAFLIADGVMPSNVERGYVLRRIMRRGIRYGVKIGLKGPFLVHTVEAVIQHFGGAYPELLERAEFIREVVIGEERRFALALERGLALLDREFANNPTQISGKVAFTLADTYGFPVDLTRLIAAEHGLNVDEATFEALYEEQREKGRAAWKGSGEEAVTALWHQLSETHPMFFSGYEKDEDTGTVTAILSEGITVSALFEGQEGEVLFDKTPFYAESGGQMGDSGRIFWEHGEAIVEETHKPVGDLHVHRLRVIKGVLRSESLVRLAVDSDRRNRTRLNHTGTHLLHAALRQTLGGHVSQKGSLVGPERLRFDFSHHKAVSQEELQTIEDIVNQQILANNPVTTDVQSIDDARKAGAMALFGEKYGDDVRVVTVGGFSKELCGGTHARRSGDIGYFKILSEAGIAAGVRRIEAQTGPGAHAWIRQLEGVNRSIAAELKTTPDRLLESIQRIQEDKRRIQKELEQAKRELARLAAGDLNQQVVEVNGIKLLAVQLSVDMVALREEAERWCAQLGSCVVVMSTIDGGEVKIVAMVSKDLAGKRVHAGKLVSALAALVGGRGGGRPDFAQAGGKDQTAMATMLAAVPGLLN